MAAMEVLMLLEGKALERVYDEFKRKADETGGDGLTLDEFIATCLKNISATSRDRVELVDQLTELFAEIDVNGDKQLEWSEFLGFIADAGAMGSIKRIPPRPFRYEFDTEYVDRCSRPDCKLIRKLIRLPGKNGCIYALEDGCREIRMYDQVCNRPIGTIPLQRDIKRRADQPELTAIDMELIPEHNLIAVLLSDFGVGLWFTAGMFFCHGMLPRRGAMAHCLAWNRDSNRLFVGCKDGRVQVYDVENRKLVAELRGHTDVVSSVLSVSEGTDGAIVTHGLDKRTLVWDATLNSTRPQPVVGTRKLLQCLTWMQRNQRLVAATLGGSGEILGWDLAVTGVAFQLVGHRSDVVAMQALQNDSRLERLVSVDTECNFRVWEISDAATGEIPCISVFSPPTVSVQLPSCMLVLTFRDRHGNSAEPSQPPKGSAARGATGLSLLPAAPASGAGGGTPKSEPRRLPAEDEYSIILGGMRMQLYRHSFFMPGAIVNVALHNPVTHTFVTCVGRELSMWTDHNGGKTMELPKAFEVDATALCFDDRKRKVIIGLSDGSIAAYNCLNGAVMKKADTPHTAEVTSLTYHVRDRNVLSTSRDGTIIVHNEEPQETLTTLRSIAGAHDGECSCGDLSEELAYIATGGADGVVRVWNYETCELVAELVDRVVSEKHSQALSLVVTPESPAPGGILGESVSDGSTRRGAIEGIHGEVGPPILGVKLCADRPFLLSCDATGAVKMWGLHVDGTFLAFVCLGSFLHSHPETKTVPVPDTSRSLATPSSSRFGMRAAKTTAASQGLLQESSFESVLSPGAKKHLKMIRGRRRPPGIRQSIDDEAERWWEAEQRTNSNVARVIEFLLDRKKRAGLLVPESKAEQRRQRRLKAAAERAVKEAVHADSGGANASAEDEEEGKKIAALYAVANAATIREEMIRFKEEALLPELRQHISRVPVAAQLLGVVFDEDAAELFKQSSAVNPISGPKQDSPRKTFVGEEGVLGSDLPQEAQETASVALNSIAACVYDDMGMITIYDLSLGAMSGTILERYMAKVLQDKLPINRGGYEALRTVRIEKRGFPKRQIIRMHSFPKTDPRLPSCPRMIECKRQFAAHKDAIRSGQLVRASGKYCVLTGSMDGRLRLWSVTGMLVGQLCTPQWEEQLWKSSAKENRPPWVFPSELQAEKERAREEAKVVASRIGDFGIPRFALGEECKRDSSLGKEAAGRVKTPARSRTPATTEPRPHTAGTFLTEVTGTVHTDAVSAFGVTSSQLGTGDHSNLEGEGSMSGDDTTGDQVPIESTTENDISSPSKAAEMRSRALMRQVLGSSRPETPNLLPSDRQDIVVDRDVLEQARFGGTNSDESDPDDLVPLEIIQGLDQKELVEDLAKELDGPTRDSRRPLVRQASVERKSEAGVHGSISRPGSSERKDTSESINFGRPESPVSRARKVQKMRERVTQRYKHAFQPGRSLGRQPSKLQQRYDKAASAATYVSSFVSSRLPLEAKTMKQSMITPATPPRKRLAAVEPRETPKRGQAQLPSSRPQLVSSSLRSPTERRRGILQSITGPKLAAPVELSVLVRPDLKSDPITRRRLGARLAPLDEALRSKLRHSESTYCRAALGSPPSGGIMPASRYRRSSTAMGKQKLEVVLRRGSATEPDAAVLDLGLQLDIGVGDISSAGASTQSDKPAQAHELMVRVHTEPAPGEMSLADDDELDYFVKQAYKAAGSRPPRRTSQKVTKSRVTKVASDSPTGDDGSDATSESEATRIKVPTRFGPYSALEVIRMRRVFESIDRDGSGSVELEELQEAPEWKELFSPDEIVQLFDAMDVDGSGDISLDEVFRAVFPMATASDVRSMIRTTKLHRTVKMAPRKMKKRELTAGQRAEIEAVFKAFDINNEGFVTVDNIKQVMDQYRGLLSDMFGIKEITDVLASYDEDGNMAFDVDEFTVMMKDRWLADADAGQ